MIRYFLSSDLISDDLKSAAKKVSEYLKSKGIPHGLVGGIAAGIYSNPRATADIDFLVPESAESDLRELGESRSLDSAVPGLSVDFDGVEVDFLYAPDSMPDSAYSSGSSFNGVPVLSAEAFILMKILSGRVKDIGDIIEVIKSGKVDIKRVRSYIKTHSPNEVEDFNSLAELAEVEKSMGDKRRKASIEKSAEFKSYISSLIKRIESSERRSIRVCSYNLKKLVQSF